ncbi:MULTISPECIES: CoA-binding protein [unclassified Campylobacter]|uniref:CoA-binding protein n=1 Tax=unclassified Campylobacter TaxID=2593542 RepID=UPI0022E9F5C3|nr:MULTISPECIES: CoA-binding protein [unclassified Campylobacter]MDA3062624.1 CoA-binding protein [Campylobacter sp. JMF_14 EL1]MDA3073880.1 CoA-binding protein [Campylobacter sp. JMF_10 EL2]
MISEILQNAKNIAIVGLSPNQSKPSNRVGQYLAAQNFKIFPIYPRFDEILGRKVYRNLKEINDKIDIVVMFRKGEFANALFSDVLACKAKTLWLQVGIFNDSVAFLAQKNGVNFIQNKCIMIEHKNLKG